MTTGSSTRDVDEMPVSYVAPPHVPTTRELAVEAGRRSLYTGACIRRNCIVIATIEGSAATGYALRLKESAQVELEDRDQEPLRWFLQDLQEFVAEAGIKKVLLKSLPTTGRFNTGLGYKIEAATQLLSNVQVELVHFNTIEKWKRHSGRLAPKPIAGLSHWQEEAHRNAIATACYGEMHSAQTIFAKEHP